MWNYLTLSGWGEYRDVGEDHAGVSGCSLEFPSVQLLFCKVHIATVPIYHPKTKIEPENYHRFVQIQYLVKQMQSLTFPYMNYLVRMFLMKDKIY